LSKIKVGGVPSWMDLRLSPVDAPNVGSMLLDAIHGVKIVPERKYVGHVPSVSAYAFKHLMKVLPLSEADELFKEYTRRK